MALQTLAVQRTENAFTYEIVVIHTDSPGTEEAIRTVAAESAVPIRGVKELRKGGVLARNRGIDEAKGAWLALFDDDQTADPGWLKALWDVAHKFDAKNVGGALTLRFPSDNPRPLSQMCRRLLGETAPWDEERPYTAQEGPGSGNQMIHRSVFEQIGRWDPDFSLRGYDSEIYSRMHLAGIRSWFTPHATGVHHIPESRLTNAFFRELGLHNGWQFAKRDLLAHGKLATFARAAARVGQAIVWHLPKVAINTLRRNPTQSLDGRVKIWRAVGYLRSFLLIAAPWVPQKSFLKKHPFRVQQNKDVPPALDNKVRTS
jgi:GT2 family glycosyltransferase